MNKIKLSGTIIGEPVFSHMVLNESFYAARIVIKRKSGAEDILNCIVPEIFMNGIVDGAKVVLIGEIRTRNENTDVNTKRLRIYVFVSGVFEYAGYDEQSIEIEGYVCKEPRYRETPLGREIADIIIASDRERSRKSDYIPCIAWGRNALRMASVNIGDKVTARGRLQSRTYMKKIDEDNIEERTAYELSLSYIEVEGNANETNN